jgi:tRNA threonylcarbamoyladenosine biosynthesis protein TsaE
MKKNFKLDEKQKTANSLLKSVIKKKTKASMIIAMSGELGAGKTTLTQEIAKLLGVKEKIISPTFVIMKKYQTNNKNFKKLIHIDAYRLNNSQELLNLGWQELVSDKNNLIIVEWPERVPECFKNDVCRVLLSHQDEQTRTIEILL